MRDYKERVASDTERLAEITRAVNDCYEPVFFSRFANQDFAEGHGLVSA